MWPFSVCTFQGELGRPATTDPGPLHHRVDRNSNDRWIDLCYTKHVFSIHIYIQRERDRQIDRYRCIASHCIALYYIILDYIILYYTIIYFIILYYVILYYIILYYIKIYHFIYYIVLQYMRLYCIVLYYIILYYMHTTIHIHIYIYTHLVYTTQTQRITVDGQMSQRQSKIVRFPDQITRNHTDTSSNAMSQTPWHPRYLKCLLGGYFPRKG